MKKKGTLIAGVLLVLVCVLAGVIAIKFKPQTAAGDKNITVIVVHGDGSEKEFAYQTDEEYLGPVILGEGLVVGEQGPYGLMISAVDGEEASWEKNQSYWALHIGTEYATTGADTTPIADGDMFSLVYTIG